MTFSPHRSFRIGMPQMAAGCLSENWLLKELGAFHWDTLCASLGRQSHELADGEGRRLYSTFVRVRLSFAGTLSEFHEGDELSMRIEMARFGRSTLLSAINISGTSSSATAEMMSTFSFRTTETNTALAKSEPPGNYDTTVKNLTEPPTFFAEYSDVRRSSGKERTSEAVTDLYPINRFTDSNGANLLYFASYQSIHDFLVSRDAPDFHTKTRDIFYFRNCDLTDSIHAHPTMLATDRDKMCRDDMLFRLSDGQCIALVSSVKERRV